MNDELKKRIISSIILLPIVISVIIQGSYLFIFFLIICLFISFYEWHSMSKNKSYYFFGLFFLLISFYCAFKIRYDSNDEHFSLLLIISLCILTDIGGYIFGNIFKGPKLTKYSPNKTYSGLVGGYLLSLSIIPILHLLNLQISSGSINVILFVVLISTVSQIGDIIVSFFKRISKIKDTGKIIPGHGGLLDRIDGIIFAIPFYYLIILSGFVKL